MNIQRSSCRILGLFLFALLLSSSRTTAQQDIPRAIIITFSGVRTDDLGRFCPCVERLKTTSIFYKDVISGDYQFHMPAVMAINSGVHYDNFYMGHSTLRSPSLFQLFRKKYGMPAKSAWSIGVWNAGIAQFAGEGWGEDTYPDQIVSYSTGSEFARSVDLARKDLADVFSKEDWDVANAYGKLLTQGWPFWDSYDEIQFSWLMKILSVHHPYLVHYVMNGPDSAHYNTWAHYAFSLKDGCQRIETLLQFLQSDAFYRSSTHLIITIDHARDRYYMQHDENSSARPSHVWAFWFKPGLKQGIAVDREINHKDIFATLKSLFSIPGDYGNGKVLKEVVAQ